MTGWGMALYGKLSARGMTGDDLLNFCMAVGNGSESHVVGAPFTTADTGSTAGAGSGSGTGVTVVASAISAAIYAAAISYFGQAGNKLLDICDDIGAACAEMMSTAILTSAHSPVFAGSGNLTGITVNGTLWGDAIKVAAAFTGDQWPNFSAAIGSGCAPAVAGGSGSVTITGAGAPGTPGAGVGAGAIS